jgi:hypothetical protein
MGLEELLLELAEKRGEKKGATAIAIAPQLKKEGFPVAQIEKFTRLSARKIEKL